MRIWEVYAIWVLCSMGRINGKVAIPESETECIKNVRTFVIPPPFVPSVRDSRPSQKRRQGIDVGRSIVTDSNSVS